jgi:hypothetical protein
LARCHRFRRYDVSRIADRATSGGDILVDNGAGADHDAVADDKGPKHYCTWADSDIVAKTGIILDDKLAAAVSDSENRVR